VTGRGGPAMTGESVQTVQTGATVPHASVALVGFMAAGKSAVGRALATALGLPFADADDLLVEEAGPITSIFAERGEAGFRALESRVVTEALREAAGRPCVLALGGGAVLSDGVREALGSMPHVVWLTARPEELWARAAASGAASRPLAADETSFRALLAAREPLYRQVATTIVDTGGRTPAAVAAGLAVALASRNAGEPARTSGGGGTG